MLAWDHLKLVFGEIEQGKKLTPQHLQELSTLSTEFPYAVRLLANGSLSPPRTKGLPYSIVEAGAVIEVLSGNLHCSCKRFSNSLADDSNLLACRHHLAVRLYRALADGTD